MRVPSTARARFVQPERTEPAPPTTPMRDADTQVDDWQRCPGFEIEWEIACLLTVDDIPLLADKPVHLRRDYHMRETYKGVGATYNGGAQQRSLQPGVDLRRVLDEHLDWNMEPHMIRMRILLHIMM